MKRFLYSFIMVCMMSVSGCVSLPLTHERVVFDDPWMMLGIRDVEPTEQEQAGVLLRMNMPENRAYTYEERARIFGMIQDKKGVKFDVQGMRVDTYSEGSSNDTYVLESRTKMKGGQGRLFSTLERTDRGAIVAFIKGMHYMGMGKLRLQDWTRTPIFPEGSVRIGDVWEYTERMDARIQSWFVKDIAPEPYVITATSKLTGFATVDGVRCAVVETTATERKHQILKVLFKRVECLIDAEIRERKYVDYMSGCVVAKITDTKSRTQGVNMPLSDRGESRMIVSLVK